MGEYENIPFRMADPTSSHSTVLVHDEKLKQIEIFLYIFFSIRMYIQIALC